MADFIQWVCDAASVLTVLFAVFGLVALVASIVYIVREECREIWGDEDAEVD